LSAPSAEDAERGYQPGIGLGSRDVADAAVAMMRAGTSDYAVGAISFETVRLRGAAWVAEWLRQGRLGRER
jgi:hypothetical protein